jgi:hypothetical protein
MGPTKLAAASTGWLGSTANFRSGRLTNDPVDGAGAGSSTSVPGANKAVQHVLMAYGKAVLGAETQP